MDSTSTEIQSKGPNEEEDIISKLPDGLLIQILSLLSETDATRTRILSSRWKDVWALLPNLRFVMRSGLSVEDAKKFNEFVDRVLHVRGSMPIVRFSLYCLENCDYERFYGWVCDVVKCQLQELELGIPPDGVRVKFCWNLFKTCNTLVRLTLKGKFVLDVPEDALLFPCLKNIVLGAVVYSGDQSFVNLISGCPVLEDLYVKRKSASQPDNLNTCKVSSPSLKRLKTSFWLFVGHCMVVIDAPQLEHLTVVDQMLTSEYYLTRSPVSLVEVCIKTAIDRINDTVAHLVRSLSSVEILTLSDPSLLALINGPFLNIRPFPNLVDLDLGIDCIHGCNWVPQVLCSMPNLEHISFSYGLLWFPAVSYQIPRFWMWVSDVPACLRFTTKTITILDLEASAEEEFNLIRYLLKHSKVLEIMRIKGCNVHYRFRELLTKLHRGSPSCQLEFI